ncbi:type III restriction enzyme res subunit [Mycolicibacter terrae]|nr:type III restriction enzyme res subunit [Mycolicibacter terrae]
MDTGVYESLLNEQLMAQLTHHPDLHPDYGTVDDAEHALTIARYLAPIIERSLRSARTVEDRVALAHRILDVLPDTYTDGAALHTNEPGKVTRLDEVRHATALGAPKTPRPATPFSDAALMTNARNEPTLAAELRAELASADRVDLLCAFVKWQGLRLLEKELTELRERSIPLRVITTTYLGATDARALDALVNEFGAEVRVNYDTTITRLHAKAWLLRRNTGFHTAYVGSSNLSHAALVDGLEWNVRLSAIATPHLLEKFRATFDSYWENRDFEPYRPGQDGERLRQALQTASGDRKRDPLAVTLSGLEVRPKPFQAEMLEQLDAERTLHDRHRNLIVAATGTGKTVMAALDYRRLARDIHGRDLTLLFVAHRHRSALLGPTRIPASGLRIRLRRRPDELAFTASRRRPGHLERGPSGMPALPLLWRRYRTAGCARFGTAPRNLRWRVLRAQSSAPATQPRSASYSAAAPARADPGLAYLRALRRWQKAAATPRCRYPLRQFSCERRGDPHWLIPRCGATTSSVTSTAAPASSKSC